MAELIHRQASLGDLKNMWALLRQAASDIPFALDSEAAQESVLSELMACCTSGLSPLAVDADQSIVGALLVRRDDFEWGFRNGTAVHVAYAAVAPSHQDKSVLRALLAQVQSRKAPIFASVKSGDKLGLAAELEALGFSHDRAAASEDLYKWEPAPAN